jgi:hypothetical protein
MIYSDEHAEQMIALEDIVDLEYLSLQTPRISIKLASGDTLNFRGDQAQRMWRSFVAARREEYADGSGTELLPWGQG